MRKTQDAAQQIVDDAQSKREQDEAEQRRAQRLEAMRKRWIENLQVD